MKVCILALFGLFIWAGCAGDDTASTSVDTGVDEEELPFEQWYPGAGTPEPPTGEAAASDEQDSGASQEGTGSEESPTRGAPVSEENSLGECTDGFDNNNNGMADCDDPTCSWVPDCQGPGEEGNQGGPGEGVNPGECSDLDDNDGDGMYDCNDPDCQGTDECLFEGDEPGECTDGADNDKDGDYDCDDSDCWTSPDCSGDESVTGDEGGQSNGDEGGQSNGDEGGQNNGNEGGQNNGDEGGQNNGDEGAGGVGENTENACSDGEDNDGDNQVDCKDSECQNFEICDGMTCAASGPITCNSEIEGNTEDGIANIAYYNCENSEYSSKNKNTFVHNGPEVVYSFKSSQEWLVTVDLTTLGVHQLNVWVLEGSCNGEYSCYATPTNADDLALFPAKPGVTYYIVVDGFDTWSGPFKLDVTCDIPEAE